MALTLNTYQGQHPQPMKVPRLLLLFLSASLCSFGQKAKLADLKSGENCVVLNRTMSPLKDGNRSGVSLDEKEGDGLVWLDGISFESGTIEVDIRGRNKPGQSFVGIAFHGAGDDTYDAIYFRPFNFQSPDPTRKSHSVQYISMPEKDWSVLRQQFPGKYENLLTESVDPDDWFHARIQVSGTSISVFVNGASSPSLVVDKLNPRQAGKVGLWVGNGSAGDFSNLSISNAN